MKAVYFCVFLFIGTTSSLLAEAHRCNRCGSEQRQQRQEPSVPEGGKKAGQRTDQWKIPWAGVIWVTKHECMGTCEYDETRQDIPRDPWRKLTTPEFETRGAAEIDLDDRCGALCPGHPVRERNEAGNWVEVLRTHCQFRICTCTKKTFQAWWERVKVGEFGQNLAWDEYVGPPKVEEEKCELVPVKHASGTK